MKLRTLLLIGVLPMTVAWTAEAASLRSRVTIQDDTIRVGDVFSGAGDAADAEIGRAPAPGERRIFDLRKLRDIARRHGLKWSPASRHDRAVVDRAYRMIERDELERAMERALVKSGAAGHLAVSLFEPRSPVRTGVKRSDAFRLVDVRFDPRSNRVSATMIVPAGQGRAKRVAVSGRAQAVVEVPVLTRRIGRGDVIRRGDIKWRRMEKSRVRGNIVRDRKGLVGLAARHSLRPNMPLRESDVRPPVIVSRGSLVTLALQTGRMILTTKGKALENGAKGQTIQVVNSRSKRIIEGIVEGAGRVRIPATIDPALRSDAATPSRGGRS